MPVEHTARARDVLGLEPVLAVEQTALMGMDAGEARSFARAWAEGYLDLPNYARNWHRLGYDPVDGLDRLIDAAFVWGSAEEVMVRVRAHLDAGADHVCIQVLSGEQPDTCLPQLRELFSAL